MVVLVPRLLLEQWKYEVESFIPNANILPVGSGYSDWKSCSAMDFKETFEENYRITIAINDTQGQKASQCE